MNVISTAIPEVLIIEPKVFGDQRGFFLETFKADRYAENGVSRPFVQDNLSRSTYGVLRGLHLQNPKIESVATFLELQGDPNLGANAVNILAPRLPVRMRLQRVWPRSRRCRAQ